MSGNTNSNKQATARSRGSGASRLTPDFQTFHATRNEARMNPHTAKPQAPPALQAPQAPQAAQAIRVQAGQTQPRHPTVLQPAPPIVTRQYYQSGGQQQTPAQNFLTSLPAAPSPPSLYMQQTQLLGDEEMSMGWRGYGTWSGHENEPEKEEQEQVGQLEGVPEEGDAHQLHRAHLEREAIKRRGGLRTVMWSSTAEPG
jgi:hypothetical protein